jgi:hypothetical protein
MRPSEPSLGLCRVVRHDFDRDALYQEVAQVGVEDQVVT